MLKKTIFTAIYFGLLFNAATAFAVSFDCQKASKAVEKMICASPKLSELDDELNLAYKNAHSAPNADPKRLRTTQLAWLRIRNLCTTEFCVTASYRSILNDLGQQEKGVVVTSAMLGELVGRYTRPSACWIFDTKGNPQKCGEGVKDVLNIRKASADSVQIDMESVQSNAHTCDLDGVAKIENGMLTYKGNTPGNDQAYVQIIISKQTITLRTPDSSAYCGMRAIMNGLTWERDTKRALTSPEK